MKEEYIIRNKSMELWEMPILYGIVSRPLDIFKNINIKLNI